MKALTFKILRSQRYKDREKTSEREKERKKEVRLKVPDQSYISVHYGTYTCSCGHKKLYNVERK
jgi:hypothetical protein